MEDDSKPYHTECYNIYLAPKCNFCRLIIKSGDTYFPKEKNKYHEKCYKKNIAPKCSICKSPIMGKYSIDAWGNSFHQSHDNLNCSSCARIVSQNTSNGGIQLSENRTICGFCNLKLVKTNREIENSRESVLLLLEEVGFSGISKYVPIQIVDKKTICNLTDKNNCENQRGLTHYEYTYNSETGKKISMGHNTIYILDYLHELEFISVLAHEYLHVWLHVNNIEYPSAVIEGFCNLASALIYKNNSSKFSEIKLEEMFENPDPDYGIGFRKMNSCLKQYGWEILIEKMRNNDELLCFELND